MSYKERRKELVRQEGYLMERYITASRNKDKKQMSDIQKHIDVNVRRRELLKRNHGSLG